MGHGSLMSGMIPMYVLMSAFHVGALAEADCRLAKLMESRRLPCHSRASGNPPFSTEGRPLCWIPDRLLRSRRE